MAAMFLQGDRVRLTSDGLEAFSHRRDGHRVNLGTVTSHQRGHYVSVRLDGNKTSSSFHVDFFERFTEEEPK